LLGIPADNIDSIPESRRDNTILQATASPNVAPIVRSTARDVPASVAKAQIKTH
jgi:hypothetical protein